MKKRKIKYIVIHCTDTYPSAKLEAIKKYWRDEKGWVNAPGYHYITKFDGDTIQLLDENKNSNGVYGHNSETINLAYIGGRDKKGKHKDTRSRQQEVGMFNKIVELTERHRKAQVLGHRDFPGVKKACPCFDVKSWLANYTPDLDIAA